MTEAVASKSLVSLTLPKSGAARIAAQIVAVLAGSLLIALAARTKVVLGPVDMSMQSLVIMVLAASFGMRLGIATVAAYLVEGALGMPVFQSSPEKGIGLVYMLGTTGGYLVGFLVMAALIGWAADRGRDRSPFSLVPVMLVANALMMVLGFVWLAVLIGPEKSWEFGVLPFIMLELLKVGIAGCLVPAGWGLAYGFTASGKDKGK